MAKFAIYQYLLGTTSREDFSGIGTLNFDGGVDEIAVPVSNEEKQRLFKEMFDKNVLEFKEDDKQTKPYPYIRIPCEANDNIIILRIAANKKKNFEQNFTDVSEDWNPSTLIVIDNRKDIQRIAIQVKSNAFSPSHLARILQKVFEERLRSEHITIQISPKMYSGDFWKVTNRHQGRIQYVKFDFTRQYLQDICRVVREEQGEGDVTKLLEGLESLSKMMNVNPSILTKACEQSVEINQTDAQLQEIVRVSSGTGQPIKVMTLDGISYDCYLLGDEEPTDEERKHDKIVMQELADNVVNQLIISKDESDTELFSAEYKRDNMLKLISFMNNLKLSYD